jgi:two-component system phosphate regulon response regulator PhoB
VARILVVEHDKETREVLDVALRSAGHAVRLASTGRDALRLAGERPPDIVLLDLGLPDLAAIDVARPLRIDPRTAEARVIGERIDHIVGVEHGADDCVVTPFTVRDLDERIKALYERARRPGEGLIVLGELRIDRDTNLVQVAGKEIELTAIERRLLVTLCDRRDRIQTRDVLLGDVWGIQASVSTRTVDTHIKRLREKIGSMRDCIQTVRGVGYRFVLPSDPE